MQKCSEATVHVDAKDDYHPNIPTAGNGPKEGQLEKSPQLRAGAGNVRFIAKRGNFGETVVIGDDVSPGKLAISKYGVGGSDLGIGCETVNATAINQRGCLSEKSSDSGVSSSSISSAPPPRDKILVTAVVDSPTKTFGNFARGSPTSQGSSKQNDNCYP